MNQQRRTSLTASLTVAITIAALGVAAAGTTVTPQRTAAPESSSSISVGHLDELLCLHSLGTTPCTNLSI